jgi:hypothetical protein
MTATRRIRSGAPARLDENVSCSHQTTPPIIALARTISATRRSVTGDGLNRSRRQSVTTSSTTLAQAAIEVAAAMPTWP